MYIIIRKDKAEKIKEKLTEVLDCFTEAASQPYDREHLMGVHNARYNEPPRREVYPTHHEAYPYDDYERDHDGHYDARYRGRGRY